MDAHEHQILEFDVVRSIPNSPVLIRFIFQGQGLAVLHEALDTFGHVLCQLGESDRPRRAAKIFGWDLAAPLAITRPLNQKERRQNAGHVRDKVCVAYLKSNGHAGTAPFENDLITISQFFGS